MMDYNSLSLLSDFLPTTACEAYGRGPWINTNKITFGIFLTNDFYMSEKCPKSVSRTDCLTKPKIYEWGIAIE